MTGRAAVAAVGLGVTVLLGPAAAATAAAPPPAGAAVPCPNGRPAGPHVACTGPVTHHAGGGGGVLTIVVSVVVGLGVAGAALALVRRRIAVDATRPSPAAARPRRPS
jgi:hypothetical protein